MKNDEEIVGNLFMMAEFLKHGEALHKTESRYIHRIIIVLHDNGNHEARNDRELVIRCKSSKLEHQQQSYGSSYAWICFPPKEYALPTYLWSSLTFRHRTNYCTNWKVESLKQCRVPRNGIYCGSNKV